ncbi:glutamine amidotransferase [Vulcanisaeta distributa]|uniref:glutamine amidotransferase n=1 Tax=Vulcanisaeta distributa TaxID=164451 RepID=UPI0006CFF2D3|nr:glutamine amidotransferase [Vulcanisaeta distributa]
MKRIGVLSVRGAMPYYEELPFNVRINEPGIIKDLDLLILPPGTLVESQVLQRYGWIEREIWDYVERGGGFTVGVCSGTQLLSRAVNLNVKGLPGYSRGGLGILDIVFEPLIVTGPVRVRITSETWVTRDLVGTELTGWQAHTYGRMRVLSDNVQVIGVSHIPRYNYRNEEINAPTLVVSRKYNVFGTMVHGILGQNSPIMRNILSEIGVTEDEVPNYYRGGYRENDWVSKRGGDSGVGTRVITVASTMTGEGKTLITSALMHCLSGGAGYYVGGVAKLAGDIRDLHPSLYILNRPLKPWMSIKLRWGGSKSLGWVNWREVLRTVRSIGLDVLIVEGVMGLLTGSSRRYRRGFSSTLDFIRQVNTDVVLIASANFDGIEGALLRLKTHIDILARYGRKPILAILNNAYTGSRENRMLRNFERKISELGILFVTVEPLPIHSKPEELIDLEDYKEASMKISGTLCNAVINALGKSRLL